MSAESAVWQVLTDLTIGHARFRELAERLEADFDADAGGYAQLHAVADEEVRAVLSDEICQSAFAVRGNLIEARLYQYELAALVGGEGVKMPDSATAADAVLQSARLDKAVTGSMRALGSALDCMSAVAVGILRMPVSIHKASFQDIRRTVDPKTLAKGTADQQKAWSALNELCDRHRKKPPGGWLDWLFGMRNLNVHRARQVHMLLQRTRSSGTPQLLIATVDPVEFNKSAARFDLHLRKRPELADMEDFISTAPSAPLWINEPATTTVPGIISMTVELIEEMSHLLLSYWRHAEKWSACYPPPPTKWVLGATPAASFDGIAPSATPFPTHLGITGLLMAERLRLAERLRQARTP